MKKLVRIFRKDGLSVALFRNEADGKWFVKISKIYETADGKSHETTYYTPQELLPMARLIAHVSKIMKSGGKEMGGI